MFDIMIDIETMSTAQNAVMLSVSACYFDKKTGKIGKKFDEQINLNSSFAANRDVSASTLIWWMQQDDSARKQFSDNKNAKTMTEILSLFSAFVDDRSCVWGNGSSFDLGILKSAYDKCKIPVPWMFWNERDVRTIVSVGYMLDFNPKKDMPFVGVRHNALDDSIHQAKYVSEIFKKLEEQII